MQVATPTGWQGAAGQVQAALSAADLRALVADNPTFEGFVAGQFETLAGLIEEVRPVEAGTYLLREGDPADRFFIVQAGRFEIMKREEEGDQVHRIATLGPGMSVGEIALLDRGARSASVRALEDARVLVIPIRSLERRSTTPHTVDAQMKIGLGHELARRLRTTNEATVRSLRAKLHEALIRAEMGRFMSRVLIGTCLYMFTLSLLQSLAHSVPDTTIISAPILIAFAIGLFLVIKTSSFPVSAYGFTTRNWRPAVKEAIVFSLPVAAMIVLVKGLLVHTLPAMAGQPIFDLYRSKGAEPQVAVLAALGYSLFAPVQEMVARSGMQSSLMLFLTGRHKTINSIVLATILFSATHLHISITLALLVFPIGLFWGWLYARNPTLIGVCLSHVALGLFGLFVVGFPTR